MPQSEARETPSEKAARIEARKNFETAIRQAAMEFDALDTSGDSLLNFDEFSRLIRERELGVHSERNLEKRFAAVDVDGSGHIEVSEFITFALRDAFARFNTNLKDLFAAWDESGDGVIGILEFRAAVRYYGFHADDDVIDAVFTGFDARQRGYIEIFDLEPRLKMEARGPLRGQRLRCLEWREGHGNAHVETLKALATKLNSIPPYRVGQRIMAVLQGQSARVMDLFRSWDTNGDGLISRAEFGKVVHLLGFEERTSVDDQTGIRGLEKVVDALFRELDKDGSGSIEYLEMKAAICPPPAAAPTAEPSPYLGWNAEAKKARAASFSDRFKSASIVRGIKLSPDFDLFPQLARGLAENWGKLQWLFDRFDIDGNGTISRHEIRYALFELGLSAHPNAVDAFFDAMDVDQSGEVSYEEFELAIRASLRAAKSERLQAISGGAAVKGGVASPTLPPVSGVGPASHVGSVGSSPRNRVGQMGGFPGTHQHVLFPAPPTRMVMPPVSRVPRAALNETRMPSITRDSARGATRDSARGGTRSGVRSRGQRTPRAGGMTPRSGQRATPRVRLPERVPPPPMRTGEKKKPSPRELRLLTPRSQMADLTVNIAFDDIAEVLFATAVFEACREVALEVVSAQPPDLQMHS